jgi:hypothetical protein
VEEELAEALSEAVVAMVCPGLFLKNTNVLHL